MDSLKLMVEEHRNIKRMLAVIRRYCYLILKGESIQYEDFFMIIDFIRNYADKHHHGKEETYLFNRMIEELGPAAEKLVRHGMLVEHDMGRFHTQELEAAVKKVMEGDEEAKLDVIANAISYTHLLNRHIQKEDDTVYKFAQRNFSIDTMDRINRECEAFEAETEKMGIQQKYTALISEMESRISLAESQER